METLPIEAQWIYRSKDIDRYRKQLELEGLRPRTIEDYIINLEYIIRNNAFRSEAHFIEFFADKKQNVGDSRFNNLCFTVKRFLNFYKSRFDTPNWLIVESDALKVVPKSKRKNILELWAYSKEEAATILENCKDWSERAHFWFALHTGARSRTLLELTINDISEEGVNILAEYDKMSMPRYVPFTSDEDRKFVENYLKYRSIMVTDSDHLFLGNDGKSLRFEKGTRSNTYLRLKKACGFRVALHSCRYTFAVNVWKQTGNLYLVQYLLGHKNTQQTVEYLKIKEHDMRQHVRELMRDVRL